MKMDKIFTGLKIATTLLENNGKFNADVIFTAAFDHRLSSETSHKEKWEYVLALNHDDFPALAKYETVSFLSGNNNLKGYLYKADRPKGLILYVHGIGSNAFDWYAIGQNEWVLRGYCVFAIELTASGSSQGYGIPSLSQSALDVAAAVSYVQSRHDLKHLPLFLFGHSWGGYGVVAANHFAKGVKAVASLSGFACPVDEMIGLPEAKLAGIKLGDTKPLEEALIKRAGEYANLSAVEAIRSSKVPFFIAHGGEDHTVPYVQASILNKAKGLPNVTPMFFKNRDHVNIFLDAYSCQKRDEAMELTRKMQERYGNNFASFDEATKAEILQQFDRVGCSNVNKTLFDAIDAFYMAHRR